MSINRRTLCLSDVKEQWISRPLSLVHRAHIFFTLKGTGLVNPCCVYVDEYNEQWSVNAITGQKIQYYFNLWGFRDRYMKSSAIQLSALNSGTGLASRFPPCPASNLLVCQSPPACFGRQLCSPSHVFASIVAACIDSGARPRSPASRVEGAYRRGSSHFSQRQFDASAAILGAPTSALIRLNFIQATSKVGPQLRCSASW